MPKNISARLKELRDERGLTNAQIAELSGVPIGTVNRLLSGQTENPTAQNIADIVAALGGSIDVVMGIKQGENVKINNDVYTTTCEMYREIIANKDAVINDKNKWIKTLFFCFIIMIFVFIAIIIFDVLNPGVGYVRY